MFNEYFNIDLNINTKKIEELTEVLKAVDRYKSHWDHVKNMNNEDLRKYTCRIEDIEKKIKNVKDDIKCMSSIIIDMKKNTKNDTLKLILEDEDFINQLSEKIIENTSNKISEMIEYAPNSTIAIKAKEHFTESVNNT